MIQTEMMHKDRANLVRLMTVVSRVQFPGITFSIEYAEHGLCVRVGDPQGVCAVTGVAAPWLGRPWPISLDITNGDLVQTLFKALLTALEHEARECFTFQGQRVMDPHRNMELVEVYDGEFSLSV